MIECKLHDAIDYKKFMSSKKFSSKRLKKFVGLNGKSRLRLLARVFNLLGVLNLGNMTVVICDYNKTRILNPKMKEIVDSWLRKLRGPT